MGRDPKHDYRSRCIYHITIGKARGCPDFSRVDGTPEQPIVELSTVGGIIEKQLRNIPTLCPALQVLQYVIMPDHIHIALFAKEELSRPLGSYLGMMKVKCGQEIRAAFSAVSDVFSPDFHDRYLRRHHNLATIIDYIRQNPYRLLVRRANPKFFQRLNNIVIGDSKWQAYGNMQLLHNPFKAPVVIHRADSAILRGEKERRWKHLAENGGVLVSPFISPDEKVVRRYCESVEGKIILLVNKPFAEREKPAVRDFELCSQDRLLILAPMSALSPGRATFLYLNSVAEVIALKNVGVLS